MDFEILVSLWLSSGSWTLLVIEASEPFLTDRALMIYYIFFFSISLSWLLTLVGWLSVGLAFSVLLSILLGRGTLVSGLGVEQFQQALLRDH